MGLLNLDEFDKIPASKMPLLKNLMQMSALSLCKAYQRSYRSLPRIASFIATSNRTDLLTDPTGSRRFLCIEVERSIDCTHLNHAQIYAQLKAQLQSGARHWFTTEEEQLIQQHNERFYRQSPLEEAFRHCFRPATGDETCQQLSLVEILKTLKAHCSIVLRGVQPVQFGQALIAAGVHRKHTRYGNKYCVVPLVN